MKKLKQVKSILEHSSDSFREHVIQTDEGIGPYIKKIFQFSPIFNIYDSIWLLSFCLIHL